MSDWGIASRSNEGILRGSSAGAKEREELLVFGYSCKLFRDDERAREVDQGKLLIPWAGDETLRIDRYDARGALHELASLEAPPGGHDWRLELTDAEKRVEQLCDEERYRALYCDEEEELMYKEEELKRLRAAGYGQIGFNYDTQDDKQPSPPAPPAEVDEPYVPTAKMQALLTPDVPLPDSQKLYAIIEKTATFIASQGAQMEILLRAKQAGNPQFEFLDKECPLYGFYQIVLNAVRNDKLNEKPEVEVKAEETEDYLHPTLAPTLVESAPSIPSIQYKPSADCAYSLLVSRMRGGEEDEGAGELAPPGTQPLALPASALIERGPVLYTHTQEPPVQYSYPPPPSAPPPPPPAPATAPPAPLKSMGLNLMHYYNSASEGETSDEEEDTKPSEPIPPNDIQVIIDKMAAYVARNGDEFEDIVKAKNDPRFTFLEPQHAYHPYYKRLMLEKRGITIPPQSSQSGNSRSVGPATEKDADCKTDKEEKKKVFVPVSFSIKKLKEPETVLPKPALPYESSDEEQEGGENNNDAKQTELNNQEATVVPEPIIVKEPLVKEIPLKEPKIPLKEPKIPLKEPIPQIYPAITEVETPKEGIEHNFIVPIENSKSTEEYVKHKSEKKRKKDKKRKENGESKKHKRNRSRSREKRSRSRENRSKSRDDRSESREKSNKIREERSRSRDKSSKSREKRNKSEEMRSKSREKRSRSGDRREGSHSREKKNRARDKSSREDRKSNKEEKGGKEERMSSKEGEKQKNELKEKEEVITIGDQDNVLIDLTGEMSDGKGEYESNGDITKQSERRRRAAAFLATVGRDVPASVTEENTLASAMVKTLEEIRAKKAAAEERERRRAERQRRRQKRRDEELDRERERSHRKSKRRKHRSSSEEDTEDYERSRKHKKEHKSSKTKRRKRSPSSRSPSADTRDPGHQPQDPEAIKTKLRKLREDSDGELNWRETPEVEKRTYSEGECESSGSSAVDTE